MNKMLFKVVNPIVKGILRSPLHGLMSRNTVLLEFRGRKSGKQYSTPVSYFEEGCMVHCCTGRPNVWWRNLVKAESVDLVLRGQSLTGVPRVLAEATDESQKLLRNLLIASPRDAAFAGVALKADGRPCESDLADAAARLVFITIKLPAEVGDGEGGGS